MFPKLNQRFILDFSTEIPHQIEEFRRSEPFFSALKQTIRTYRRFFTLLFLKQLNLKLDLIPDNASKILWLNPSSTSIGDSIMELSGRKLLNNTKFEVHLLSDRKNSSLYLEDLVFSKVFNDPSQIVETYDLILMDVYNTKSIKMKSKYFPNVSFCALQGYFYGADFNRLLFSFHRVNALLNYPYTQNEVDSLAHNYLCINDLSTEYFQVVIAVGGEDYLRTYLSWNVVIGELLELNPHLRICLLGSENGLVFAEKIVAEFGDRVTSQVAKLSLLGTAGVIARAQVFIGADGGLMHIATAFNLNGVALFAKFRPELRLAKNSQVIPIFSSSNVNQIKPSQIIAELKQLNLVRRDL